MPSYPIRPTFPVDVRSPKGTVTLGRQGASLTLDVSVEQIANALPPTSGQFFGALEAAFPGSVATLQAAVPSDPSSSINRVFNGTMFVAADSLLLAFVRSTLSLTDLQVSDLLAAAALQPK